MTTLEVMLMRSRRETWKIIARGSSKIGCPMRIGIKIARRVTKFIENLVLNYEVKESNLY